MPGLLENVDPDGLLEYSVVFTDRSLNHMSSKFQTVMTDISREMQNVYNADAVVVVPGGGTFAMEAVARQFATRKKCLVIRNGWFSFRWSQIFEAGEIPSQEIVMKAAAVESGSQAAMAPAPIEQVVEKIKSEKPDVVFAPHVETSSGMLLPDDYIHAVGEAVRSVGGLFVLDCIASGTLWVDMKDNLVDILISAPQKGWSASPCAGLVMMSERAKAMMADTKSTSFAADLAKWSWIMEQYENGGHAYHATMPTDALTQFRDTMFETRDYGFDKVRQEQIDLGQAVRELLKEYGIKSVAAEGYGAPGVVVSYTADADVQTGKKFLGLGLQIAAGVPLQCDEPADFRTFRIGLFGLDKLHHCERTVASLKSALDKVFA